MSFFEVHVPIFFATFVMGNAPVKQLATGFDWVEGPVWIGDANCLLFSDIPNNANGHTYFGRTQSPCSRNL